MELYKPKKLKDLILKELKSGPIKTLEMVDHFKKSKTSFTKQAVYLALRELTDSGVITINKGVITLYSRWLDDLADYVNVAKYNNKGISPQKSFLDLQESERIEYFFNSAQEAEMFWSHVFGLFLDVVKRGSQVYTYVPHDWFMLMSRAHSEEWQIKKAFTKGVQYLATAGNNTLLDKEAKKILLKLEGIQANNLDRPLFKKKNYYLNIFGDILIEIYIDIPTANRLEEFFKNYTHMTKESVARLDDIINNRGKNRIVISKNSKKTQKIVKKLSKDFWIKKQ